MQYAAMPDAPHCVIWDKMMGEKEEYRTRQKTARRTMPWNAAIGQRYSMMTGYLWQTLICIARGCSIPFCPMSDK